MKKIILGLALMYSVFTHSQDTEFVFKRDGFTDFIATKVENKTQAELYKKTLEWIAFNYKNPKEALKSQIENESIRFEGTSNAIVCVNSMGKTFVNAKYEIEVSFKDGKYKFDLINISTYAAPGQYGAGGWTILNLKNMEPFYNKTGEIKPVYKYYPEMIPVFFNDLNKSLKDFILSDQIPSKKSEW